MRFELCVHPGAVSGLRRVASPGKTADGRARTRAVRRIWHDSAERELLGQGLALSLERGIWRLEALAQPSPAVPSDVRGDASEPGGLTRIPPASLAPVTVFVGRETSWSISADEASVTMTLVQGVARTIADEHPIHRVVLDGPEEPVRVLVERLARSTRVEIPTRGLAAKAMALCGTGPPEPMPGQTQLVRRDLAPATAFRQVLGTLLVKLLVEVPAVLAGSPDTEPVHQMRVAVRRIRSAITVFRPAIACPLLEQAGDALKALGGCLGPTRDWDVFVTETLPTAMGAMADNPALTSLHAASERRRRECATDLRAYLEGPAFRLLTVQLAWLAAAAAWVPEIEGEAVDLPAFAGSVLHRRARKLSASGRDIETLDTPALHDLRLRAKQVRYAAEMFSGLFPGRHAPRYIRRLSRLQQCLGVLNDSAVAHGLMAEIGALKGRHAHAGGLVLGFAARGMAAGRPEILNTWEKFRRTEAFWA